MCGMVGFVGKQSAAPILLRGLQQFEYRGYDSAGVAVMDGDRIRVEKVSGRIARLCEKTDNGASVPGRTGIGHSARDSFEMLERLGVPMEPKAFSMGVRIEHRQADPVRPCPGRPPRRGRDALRRGRTAGQRLTVPRRCDTIK